MDTGTIDSQAAKPVESALAEIGSLKSKEQLPAVIAHLHSFGVDAFFAFGSTPDFKDSSKIIAEADQSGLGLPDRDYYTRADADSKALRDKYVSHVTRMFTLLGDSQEKSSAEAKTVVEIETRLANGSLTNVELRNPDTQYHILDISALQVLTPHFSWAAYFTAAGHPGFASINAGQPGFFKTMDAQLATGSLEDTKTYLRWRLLDRMGPFLSTPFETEDFSQGSRTRRLIAPRETF